MATKRPLHGVLDIRMPGLPEINSANRTHWSKRRKEVKSWKENVWLAGRGQWPAEPLPKAHVRYTRRSSTEPDYTNLVESFKAIEDALVGVVLVNDTPANYHAGHADYLWEFARAGEGSCSVQVYDLRGASECQCKACHKLRRGVAYMVRDWLKTAPPLVNGKLDLMLARAEFARLTGHPIEDYQREDFSEALSQHLAVEGLEL